MGNGCDCVYTNIPPPPKKTKTQTQQLLLSPLPAIGAAAQPGRGGARARAAGPDRGRAGVGAALPAGGCVGGVVRCGVVGVVCFFGGWSIWIGIKKKSQEFDSYSKIYT